MHVNLISERTTSAYWVNNNNTIKYRGSDWQNKRTKNIKTFCEFFKNMLDK